MKSNSLIWIMAGVLLLCLCVSGVSADGNIHVTSIPQGAAIGLNGGGEFSTDSFTDTTIPGVANGPYTVELYLDHHLVASGTTYVNEGETAEMAFGQIPGTLYVTSTPSGAVVYIDDIEQYNPTPFTYYGITPGYHRVQAARNYQSQTYTVYINAGYNTLNFDLTDTPTFGYITPTTGPTAGSQAVTIQGWNFLDGADGGTPLSVTIGGATATVTGPTDGTFIYATTPPGTLGARDVVITNGYSGNSVTGYGAYTYAVPTVHNTNIPKDYYTIQEAINDPLTLSGHVINVDGKAATYAPFIVNKPLTLQGFDTGNGYPVVALPMYSGGNAIEFSEDADGSHLTDFTVKDIVDLGGSGPSGTGVYLSPGSSDITLNKITMNDLFDGIILNSANDNRIDTCTGSGNRRGIQLLGNSENNFVDTCTLTNGYGSYSEGVAFDGSSHNTVQHSTISDMVNGIRISKNGWSGYDSTENTIFDNILTHNDDTAAVAIVLDGSLNNINTNTITDNYIGISIENDGVNNQIYNNLFNQEVSVYPYLGPGGADNVWNLAIITPATPDTNIVGGPNLGGNYWANPDGDGFSETCDDASGDGICDTGYTIDTYNVDNFPLKPVGSPPAAPVADFSADPLSGFAPLTVEFTYANSGSIESTTLEYKLTGASSWTSLPLDDLHEFTFTNAGTYDIQETVIGPGGTDIETKIGYITVVTAPSVGFISVTSDPSGAEIYLDGGVASLGTTPATISATEGPHTVKVTYTEYFDAERQVDVASGATVTAAITMDAIPALPDPVIDAVKVVLKEKLKGDTTGKTVAANPTTFASAPTVQVWGDMPSIGFTEVASGTLVFVDDQPKANWEHPCRYFFIDANGNIEEKVATSPSLNYLFTHAAGKEPDPGDPGGPNDPVVWTKQDTSKQYALLISGGNDKANNHKRYWNDIAFMYNVLIEYGYLPSHIKVLMSDGTNADPVTGLDRHIANSGTMYDSSPLDFDNNQVNDVTNSATKALVQSTLASYAPGGTNALTTTDSLFIFTTSHGGWDGAAGASKINNNVKFHLWNNEYITDDELYAKLNAINSKAITVVMEQCNSGGLYDEWIYNYAGTQKRVLITAAAYFEPSQANGFSNAWITGVGGHTMAGDIIDRNADLPTYNERISMRESYTYATSQGRDPYLITPLDSTTVVTGKEHPQIFYTSTNDVTQYLNDPLATVTKTITIKVPTASGINWPQGSIQPISWDATGLPTENVKITLWKSGVLQTPDIVSSWPASKKSYPWTVPSAQAIATTYKIKIEVIGSSPALSSTSTQNFQISAKSAVNTGKLQMNTVPTGAAVYIDESATNSGPTNKLIPDLVQGTRNVKVSLPGYYEKSAPVKINPSGATTTVTWTLEAIPTGANNVPLDTTPYGGLDVTSTPDGARIWVGKTGTTPTDTQMDTSAVSEVSAVLQLFPGDYDVYVTKDTYQQSETRTVKIETQYPTRDPVKVDFTLTQKPEVPAKALIVPNPLNIGRTGYFLAFVRMPTGYKAADVDAGSVYCEGAPALKLVRLKLFPQIFVGIFSRQDLGNYPTGTNQMYVWGLVKKNSESVPFRGSDNVNVINKPATTKEDVDSVMTMTDTQIFTKFNKL